MPDLLIGYAHVSTEQQAIMAQRESLTALGGPHERIYAPTASDLDSVKRSPPDAPVTCWS